MNQKFLKFASQIYEERPRPPDKPLYWLPALYGGDNPKGFIAVVVLEQPSEGFMERTRQKFWTHPPTSVAEAKLLHRRIFFEWAKDSPQSELFRILIDLSESSQASPAKGLWGLKVDEFFSILYVTDTWKDCLPDKKYWRSVLSRELADIRAEMVIFVGNKARQNKALCPSHLRIEECGFPSRRNRKWTRKYIQDLAYRLKNPASNQLLLKPVAAGPLESSKWGETSPLPREGCATTYAHPRLCFKAEKIEPLGMDDKFCVVTPVGAFVMTKRQFYAVFPNVVASDSYRSGRREYHYPRPPQRGLLFLVQASADVVGKA